MPKLSILCVVEKNRKAVHQPHLTVTTVIHDLNRRASLCHLSNRLRSKTSFILALIGNHLWLTLSALK